MEASTIIPAATGTLTATADDQLRLEGVETHQPLGLTHAQRKHRDKQSISLLDLAVAFRRECEACQTASQTALEHAIAAGEILLNAKKAREFECTGGFHEWVKRDCQVSVREAQRYMRLATHRGILEGVDATHVSHWSLRGALRLIAVELRLQEAASSPLEPTDETESDQKNEEPANPAAMAHIDRCQKVRHLMKKRKMKTVEADLRILVGRETRGFVDAVVARARKFGQRASKGKFESAGYDAEVIAMLLLRMAAARLNPDEAFAPKRQKGS